MNILERLFGGRRERQKFDDRIPVRTGEYGSQSVRIYDILMDGEIEADMDAFHEMVTLDMRRREAMKQGRRQLAISFGVSIVRKFCVRRSECL